MTVSEEELLVEHFYNSRRSEEAVIVFDATNRIVRQNKATESFMHEFGWKQVLSAALGRAGTMRFQLENPSPAAQLSGLTAVDVVVSVTSGVGHGRRIASIARAESFASLAEKHRVLIHAVESMDRGLALFQLDTATGMSTSPFVSKRYAATLGIPLAEIEEFGIAAVGSRVPDSDRAVSDIVLKHAVARQQPCYWPVRFLINGQLRWRRYFANNLSVDGRTVLMTGVMVDFDAEAQAMGMTDTPGIQEECGPDGQVRLVPVVAPAGSGSDGDDAGSVGDDASSVTTRDSVDGTSDSSEPVANKCTVSRVLKRRLLSALTQALAQAQPQAHATRPDGAYPDSASGETSGLISVPLPKENMEYIREELLMLVASENQGLLAQAFATNDYRSTACLLTDVVQAADGDWLQRPSVKSTPCEWLPVLQLLLHQLEAASATETDQRAGFLQSVVKTVLSLAASLSGIAETCVYILFSHELLRIAATRPELFTERRQRALLGELVSAAVRSASPDPVMLALTFWLSLQWGLFQWPRKDLCVEMISTCQDDLALLVTAFPHSSVLLRLFAIAQHNLNHALTH